MISMECQCEHAAHFWSDTEPRVNTPNGNPSHRYGVKFSTLAMSWVKTEHGAFCVCNDCASDCLAQYEGA